MKNLIACLLLALPLPALASEDHDKVRDAFLEHGMMPLAEITPPVLERFDAHLLEVEFEQKDGMFLYELVLLTEAGQMIEVYVDAKTGDIVEVEQGDWHEADH